MAVATLMEKLEESKDGSIVFDLPFSMSYRGKTHFLGHLERYYGSLRNRVFVATDNGITRIICLRKDEMINPRRKHG